MENQIAVPIETIERIAGNGDHDFDNVVRIADDMPDAHLNPGPNSPVGLVWIALSKPHYGIHGTKSPDEIGYASSHGCVRLTNWDALEVAHRISEGIDVEFVDTRGAESKVARR